MEKLSNKEKVIIIIILGAITIFSIIMKHYSMML
ncbi:hypothetical protein IMSAGC017_00313 [Thomasclavelia cocleata]|jgi:hypothetical protein|uniref:Uncharacterized protein n=1 Tax=Thomasclavelia cocleata TaxID=69824 RepID=A0A829Z7G6_9FIRM|nr:hypothetical protein IMSAGC017_00313 [Thomasclavelia cocleata]